MANKKVVREVIAEDAAGFRRAYKTETIPLAPGVLVRLRLPTLGDLDRLKNAAEDAIGAAAVVAALVVKADGGPVFASPQDAADAVSIEQMETIVAFLDGKKKATVKPKRAKRKTRKKRSF